MRKTIAVGEFTFRKIEEPAFLLLLVIAVLSGYFLSEMDTISFGNDLLFGGISQDLLQGTPIFGSFLCITGTTLLISSFYGATDIPRDIHNGCIMLIIGKPITRNEYFIGKFVGIIMIAILFYTLSFTSLIVGHLIKTGTFFPVSVLFRNLLLFLLVLPFTSMSLMFSSFFSDLSAIIISTIYIGLALAMGTVPMISQMLPQGSGIDTWLYLFYYVFPNFYHFLVPLKFAGFVLPALVTYTVALTAVFLTLGIIRIESKDLN